MKTGQIKIFISCIAIILSMGFSSYSAAGNDSLNALIESAAGIPKAKYMLQLAEKNLYNNPQNALENALKASEIAQKDKDLYFQAHLIAGEARVNLGIYKSAIESFNKALDIAEKNNNYHQQGKAYYHISTVYNILTEFELALENVYEAQKIFKTKIENKKWLANVYHLLGKIYYNLVNNKKALDFSLQAMEIRRELGDSLGIATSANNLSVIFTAMGDFEKALEYNFTSLGIMRRYSDKDGIANSLFNIGLVYAKTGKLEEALKNYDEALKIFSDINDPRSKSIVLANKALALMQLENYLEAEESLLKSLDIAKRIELIDIMALNYNMLSQLYTQREEYKKALEAKDAFTAIKDTIFNQESRNRITELEVKIETENEKREKEIIQKSKETQRNLFIAIIALALLLGAVIYNRYSTKKKAAEELQKKNQEIAMANTELENLNKQLFDANTTKDKFFSIISHDLRNPLYWFKNVTDLLSKRVADMDKEKMIETTKALDESAKHSLHLVENLFQWAKSQTGKIEYKPENINVKQISDNILNQVRLMADNKGISLISEVAEDTTAYADKNMLNTVILNLVSNGLKYTPKGGEVKIKSTELDDMYQISVSDTGIGIAEENIPKLFRIDVQYSTPGTAEESGSGLGLILCKEFTEKNGGQISVESRPGEGSTFSITVPKAE